MPAVVWWIGGGLLAALGISRAGDAAGEQVGKVLNYVLIGGTVYVAFKLARAK